MSNKVVTVPDKVKSAKSAEGTVSLETEKSEFIFWQCWQTWYGHWVTHVSSFAGWIPNLTEVVGLKENLESLWLSGLQNKI